MDDITIDGIGEMEFRRSIEEMLRRGEADGAAAKLCGLLEPYSSEGGILPARFLTVSADEITFGGWDELSERIGKYDRPELQISALSISIAHPEEVGAQPGEDGKLAPSIETSYFSDSAFPFSVAARDDLLDGYSHYGCTWQGDCEQSDSTLSVEGIDDLYGAIVRLEAKLLSSERPDIEEIRAGSLGACYLAVLIHQALRETVRKKGLPRALCVIAGRDEVYPFFDAPVMASEEYRHDGVVEAIAEGPKHYPTEDVEPEAEDEAPEFDASGYNSLLSVGVRSPKKKPVIMLDPEEAESAARLGQLAAVEDLANRDKPPRVNVLTGLSPADAEDRASSFGAHEEEPEEAEEADLYEEPLGYSDQDDDDMDGWGGEPPLPQIPPAAREPDDFDSQGWGSRPPLPTAPPADQTPGEDWQRDHADEPEPEPEHAEFHERVEFEEPGEFQEQVEFEESPTDAAESVSDLAGEPAWPAKEADAAVPEPDFEVLPQPLETRDIELPETVDDWSTASESAESQDFAVPEAADPESPGDVPQADDSADAWDEAGSTAEEEWAAALEAELARELPETVLQVADIAPPPLAAQPNFEPQSHNLRARIVKTQAPVKPRTHPFVAFLQWLINLIKRS